MNHCHPLLCHYHIPGFRTVPQFAAGHVDFFHINAYMHTVIKHSKSYKTFQVCRLWLSWSVNSTVGLVMKVEIEGRWLLLENVASLSRLMVVKYFLDSLLMEVISYRSISHLLSCLVLWKYFHSWFYCVVCQKSAVTSYICHLSHASYLIIIV